MLLGEKGGYWLTAGCVGRYQAILLDNSSVTFQTITTWSLAPLLPDMEGDLALQHDLLEIIGNQVHSSRLDLLDKLLAAPDRELYTEGSSFVEMANDELSMQQSPQTR